MPRTRPQYQLANPHAVDPLINAQASIIEGTFSKVRGQIVEYQDVHDEGLALKIEAEKQNYLNDLNKRMEQDPYLLIGQDGTPNAEASARELERYQETIRNAAGEGFWNKRLEQKVGIRMETDTQNFANTLELSQAKAVNSFNQRAFELNLDIAEERGDFNTMRSLIHERHSSKGLDDIQRDTLLFKVDKANKRSDLAALRTQGRSGAQQAQAAVWDDLVDKSEEQRPMSYLSLSEASTELDATEPYITAVALKKDLFAPVEITLPTNLSTATPHKRLAATLENVKGYTREKYEESSYSIVSDLLDDEKYQALSDSDFSKKALAAIQIEGNTDYLFEGDADYEKSFLNGVIDNILSVRGKVSSEDRINAGVHGVGGLNTQINDAVESQARDLVQSKQWTKVIPDEDGGLDYSYGKSWYGSDKPQYWALHTEYDKHKNAFYKSNPELKQKDNYFGGNQEAFHDWYFAKDGIHEKLMQSYKDEYKTLLTAKVYKEVAEYRKNGGKSWAEEKALIRESLYAPLNVDVSDAQALANYKKKEEQEQKDLAKKYAEVSTQAKRDINEQRQSLKQEADAAKQQSLNEELEGIEEQVKRQPTPQYTAESIAAYQQPVTRELSWNKIHDEQAYMEMPLLDYLDACDAQGVEPEQGLFVSLGSGRKRVPVKPSTNGKAYQLSQGAINYIYGTSLKPQELKHYINKHTQKLTFKPEP